MGDPTQEARAHSGAGELTCMLVPDGAGGWWRWRKETLPEWLGRTAAPVTARDAELDALRRRAEEAERALAGGYSPGELEAENEALRAGLNRVRDEYDSALIAAFSDEFIEAVDWRNASSPRLRVELIARSARRARERVERERDALREQLAALTKRRLPCGHEESADHPDVPTECQDALCWRATVAILREAVEDAARHFDVIAAAGTPAGDPMMRTFGDARAFAEGSASIARHMLALREAGAPGPKREQLAAAQASDAAEGAQDGENDLPRCTPDHCFGHWHCDACGTVADGHVGGADEARHLVCGGRARLRFGCDNGKACDHADPAEPVAASSRALPMRWCPECSHWTDHHVAMRHTVCGTETVESGPQEEPERHWSRDGRAVAS